MVNNTNYLLPKTEYLAALLGSIDDSIVATDEHFIIQYWNKKAEQLFGYTEEEALGRPGASILQFGFSNQTLDEARKQLVETGSWKGQPQYRTKTGNLLLLDASVTIVRDESGATIGYVGVHRDITDYNRAKTSLDTFLSFISATGDHVFVVDRQFRIAFVDDVMNQRMAEIYGCSLAAGDDLLQLLPAQRREQVRACFKMAFQGTVSQYELQMTTKQGKKLWLQANYFPVKDSNGFITHACSLVKDITPQKHVEEINEMLYRSRKLFETFMENSPIFSWITDKNGLIKYLNPSYLEIYQLTKDVIGRPLDSVFPIAISSAFRENDSIVYHMKQPLKFIESSLTPDGVERTFQVIKFPVETEDDVYVGGWAIDITQENDLRRNLSESLVKLKNSERSLKEALAKELHLNELKSRFVSMASHEFRTPLSTMLSSVYLMEKYTTTEQQPNRLKHSTKIKEAILHLNSLLDDFLTLGRLEEGKARISNSVLDLPQLLHEVMEELEPFRKEGQEVHLQYTGTEQAKTDKKFLKNILVNLLNNAIKFSGDNSVIELNASCENGRFLLDVKDEGIGISPSDQEHLFQTFFRGKNAQNIQGTGLGLNIVKRYLELLGGSIRLESVLDKGTTVSIFIPVQEAVSEPV